MLTLFLIILFQLNINLLALTLVFFLFNLLIFYINYKAKNIDYLDLLKSKIIKVKFLFFLKTILLPKQKIFGINLTKK